MNKSNKDYYTKIKYYHLRINRPFYFNRNYEKEERKNINFYPSKNYPNSVSEFPDEKYGEQKRGEHENRNGRTLFVP